MTQGAQERSLPSVSASPDSKPTRGEDAQQDERDYQRLLQDFMLDRPDIARLGMGDVTTLGGAAGSAPRSPSRWCAA